MKAKYLTNFFEYLEETDILKNVSESLKSKIFRIYLKTIDNIIFKSVHTT